MSQALQEVASVDWSLSDPSLLKTQAYINGAWVDAEDGGTFQVLNPATHEVVAEMANVGGGVHPAAASRNAAQPAHVLAATADADEVPPGWVFYEPLGRYLDPADPNTWGKVPRNAACPCAAGKKYKHCHGRVA